MVRSLLALVLTLDSTAALAQFSILDDYNSNPGSYAVDESAQGPVGQPKKWRVVLGAGLIDAPRFPGANSCETGIVPLIHASYGSFFAGVGGIGLNVYRDQSWRFAASLAPSRGRKESDDIHLQGLGDIDRTLKGRLIGSYRTSGLVVRADLSSDLAGHHQGTVLRSDLFGVFRPVDKLAVFAGPGLSWADKQYTQSYFGVTSTQSANSGLPQFEAGSGLNAIRFSLGAFARFDQHWFGVATWSTSRLQGDAADSPVTERRMQNQVLAAVAYLF
jgi:outer membrane protein